MKAHRKHSKKIIFEIMLFVCFIFLTTSCGLDEVFYIEAPSSINVPYSSPTSKVSYDRAYFEFSPSPVPENLDFDGTYVYYKIYSNYTTCSNEFSALNTLANSNSSKYSSATSLMNTYKFQKLRILNSTADPIIPPGSSNVRIRLTTYNEETGDYLRRMVFFNNADRGAPARYYDNRYFDFNRNSQNFNAPLPRTTSFEDDVSTNETVSESNVWYVTLYAFGAGHDASFSTYYSPICYLGTIAINATSNDN